MGRFRIIRTISGSDIALVLTDLKNKSVSVVFLVKIFNILRMHTFFFLTMFLFSPVIQATWEARTVGWFEVERLIPSRERILCPHNGLPAWGRSTEEVKL